MCRPVVNPTCVAGNGGVRSWGEKPNGTNSHSWNLGKTKDGTVSDCESAQTSSRSAAETWLIRQYWATSDKGYSFAPVKEGRYRPLTHTTRPRRKAGTYPIRTSYMRNGVTPMRSDSLSNPTARKGQSLSGNRMLRKAKASTPKGNGNT